MNSFEEKLIRFINDNKLLSPNQRVLVGVSGGVDSVVLLFVLRKLGYQPQALHCNFHLRDEESNRDEAFVKEFCQRLQIELTIKHFDTVAFAESNGISIEMAARDLRYDWFNQECESRQVDCLAVAHHRDDSIESFFLNLFRGTGIKGLTGIPLINGCIIRPFLPFSRQEIVDYSYQQGLSYVEDSTNRDSVYLRNCLRNEIIPTFSKINPAALPHIQQCMNRLSVVQEIYQEWADRFKAELIHHHDDFFSFEKKQLVKMNHWRTLLFEILSPLGYNSVTIDLIADTIEFNQLSGKRFLSPSHILLLDREKVFVYPHLTNQQEEIVVEQNQTEVDLGGPIVRLESIKKVPSTEIRSGANELYADLSTLLFPLKFRHWRQGDTFVPFGMKGRKKVSDYFSDQKISVYEKERIWLMVDRNEEVLWVVGYRTSEKIRVHSFTQEIYRISIYND